MLKYVIKNNGSEELFELGKMIRSIELAFKDRDRQYNDNIIDELYNLPVNKILIFPSNHNLKDKYKYNDKTKIFITDTWHYDFVNFVKEYDK